MTIDNNANPVKNHFFHLFFQTFQNNFIYSASFLFLWNKYIFSKIPIAFLRIITTFDQSFYATDYCEFSRYVIRKRFARLQLNPTRSIHWDNIIFPTENSQLLAELAANNKHEILCVRCISKE